MILCMLGKARGEEGLSDYVCNFFFFLNNIHLFIAPKLYATNVAQRQNVLFGCQRGKGGPQASPCPSPHLQQSAQFVQ